MTFGAIRSGYEERQYEYSKQTQTSTASFSTHRQMMLPENATSPELLGIAFWDAGNGVSYGLAASYAEGSTPENPIIRVSVTKGKGNVEIHEIPINEINVNNATSIEMFALCNYADAIGKGTDSTFGSWNTLKNFGYNAEQLGEFSLAGNYEEFLTLKQDWSKMVSSITNTYMQVGIYKQVMAGKKLAEVLKLSKGAEESNEEQYLDKMDLRKFISDKKNEIYEKLKNGDTEVSIPTGAQSFTEEEWDNLLSEVDDITEEMREAMREEYQKRMEEAIEEISVETLDEKITGPVEETDNVDIVYKLLITESSEIKISNFKEHETPNYMFIPEPEIGGIRILVNGKSAGVFSVDDLKIRVDKQTGTRVLISEIGGYGGAWYDAIPMDAELEKGLAEAIGVDDIEEVSLEGYYIGTHARTGIQYVMRPGDEGRGGKVLLRNAADKAKYNALAEEYYNRYPNLINSQEEGRIWASFEIVGMAERTETGFVRIGYDNISYTDNFDYKKNWSVKFTGDTWEMLWQWLKENRSRMEKIDSFNTWSNLIDELGGSYEGIWSDEELKQGYLNN